MATEQRVRSYFKILKNNYYRQTGGGGDAELFNSEVWLVLARKFKMPVRKIKDIVNPGGYFGGWE